jgi:hypothetical protein
MKPMVWKIAFGVTNVMVLKIVSPRKLRKMAFLTHNAVSFFKRIIKLVVKKDANSSQKIGENRRKSPKIGENRQK